VRENFAVFFLTHHSVKVGPTSSLLSPHFPLPLESFCSDHNNQKRMKYDYIHSSIDQDRKAAQEVWERVEKNRSESKQTGGEEGQREEGGGSDQEKVTAARLMQKNYR